MFFFTTINEVPVIIEYVKIYGFSLEEKEAVIKFVNDNSNVKELKEKDTFFESLNYLESTIEIYDIEKLSEGINKYEVHKELLYLGSKLHDYLLESSIYVNDVLYTNIYDSRRLESFLIKTKTSSFKNLEIAIASGSEVDFDLKEIIQEIDGVLNTNLSFVLNLERLDNKSYDFIEYLTEFEKMEEKMPKVNIDKDIIPF